MLEDSDDEILLKKLNDEREVLIDSIRLLDSENENINPIKQNANEAIEKIASKVHLGEKIKKIENFIFKFCPVLYKSFLVRKALNKLVMLNENAKELMLKKNSLRRIGIEIFRFYRLFKLCQCYSCKTDEENIN